METGLMDAVQRWNMTVKEQLANAGVALRFFESPSINSSRDRSGYIELESDVVIARATVWERGFCDLEMLMVSSGETVMYEHHEELDVTRLTELLNGLADRATTAT